MKTKMMRVPLNKDEFKFINDLRIKIKEAGGKILSRGKIVRAMLRAGKKQGIKNIIKKASVVLLILSVLLIFGCGSKEKKNIPGITTGPITDIVNPKTDVTGMTRFVTQQLLSPALTIDTTGTIGASNITVSLYGPNGETYVGKYVTDAEGNFKFENLELGSYRMHLDIPTSETRTADRSLDYTIVAEKDKKLEVTVKFFVATKPIYTGAGQPGSITLNWQKVPNVTKYEIWLTGLNQLLATVDSNTTTYTHTAGWITSGSSTYYKMVAYVGTTNLTESTLGDTKKYTITRGDVKEEYSYVVQVP